jgi:hypothetical protein
VSRSTCHFLAIADFFASAMGAERSFVASAMTEGGAEFFGQGPKKVSGGELWMSELQS